MTARAKVEGGEVGLSSRGGGYVSVGVSGSQPVDAFNSYLHSGRQLFSGRELAGLLRCLARLKIVDGDDRRVDLRLAVRRFEADLDDVVAAY